MTERIPPNHPLRRFFAGAIEDAFYTQLGICAPDLVSYLSEMLVNFLHIRDIYSLKSAGGQVLQDLPDMVAKAYVGPEMNPVEAERLIHRHVGDYTLYWTGIYPESLRHTKETLVEYYEQGKRSYAIASDLTSPGALPSPVVLKRLSEHFEDCAIGLNLARRNWSDPDDKAGPPNLG